SDDGPARVVGEAVDRFGGLDGLVSNAGINRPGALLQYAVDDWDRVFAVNTRATWLLAKAAHPALTAARGAIVAVASMSGSNPHANLGAYGPSKAALIMLVQVLAQEFARDGIRVNALSPGMVRTGMTAKVYADPRIAAERDALVPLGRVATPEDMADVIAFLLGPDARYVNGHDLVVDGGVRGKPGGDPRPPSGPPAARLRDRVRRHEGLRHALGDPAGAPAPGTRRLRRRGAELLARPRGGGDRRRLTRGGAGDVQDRRGPLEAR